MRRTLTILLFSGDDVALLFVTMASTDVVGKVNI